MRRECNAARPGRSCVQLPDDLTILDDFAVRLPREQIKLARTDKPRARGITLRAVDELNAVDTLAELTRTKGYMSAVERRAFERCEGRR
jgi:hypothetical protein